MGKPPPRLNNVALLLHAGSNGRPEDLPVETLPQIPDGSYGLVGWNRSGTEVVLVLQPP